MFSKTLALSLLLLTNIAFASGNGIERIRFEGEIDSSIAEELHGALIANCTPAAVDAYEIVVSAKSTEERPVDQLAVDVTYNLNVQLRLERIANESSDQIENVDVVISKYAFSNTSFAKNVEVHSVRGKVCN